MTARTAVLLLLALALLCPNATAGSAEEPEVADTPDDAHLEEVDIDSVWFEANQTHLNISMALAALPPTPGVMPCAMDPACADVGAEVRYTVSFALIGPDQEHLSPGEDAPGTYNATAWFENLDAPWGFVLQHIGGDGAVTRTTPVQGSADAGVIQWIIPLDPEVLPVPSGARSAPFHVVDTRAATTPFVCLPEVGCGALGVPDPDTQSLQPFDVAPDEGFGDNFTFAYTPPPPPAAPAPPATPKPTPEPEAAQSGSDTQAAGPPAGAQPAPPEQPAPTPRPFDLVPDDKAVPGPALPLVVLALAGLAMVRRQRL